MNPSFVFFSTLLVAAALVAPAQAELVYQLINYPDQQNGHTLSGTITTTDDAPADGILNTSEITDWEWNVTGPRSISASFGPSSTTLINGITITPLTIELPSLSNAHFRMAETVDPGRGASTSILNWSTAFNSVNQSFFQINGASLLSGGDLLVSLWINEAMVSDNSNRVIAAIVPEPTTLPDWSLVIMVLFMPLRRARVY